MEYKPAPGQLINETPWGTPDGVRSLEGGLGGTASLGAFGGYVVFRFEQAVENDPLNPYGVDFSIFGNPMPGWSEPGVVWVMKDDNLNGEADDTWYELAGSDYWFSSTRKGYGVSYTNPGGDQAMDVPWEDQSGGRGTIRANTAHTQPYYPLHDSFPSIDPDRYSLEGTCLTGLVAGTSPGSSRSPEPSGMQTTGFLDLPPILFPIIPIPIQQSIPEETPLISVGLWILKVITWSWTGSTSSRYRAGCWPRGAGLVNCLPR